MTDTEPVFIDIPGNVRAAFANDGRVFYDLDTLLSQFIPVALDNRFAAGDDEVLMALSLGEFRILDAIRQSRDALKLDAALSMPDAVK